MRLSQVDILIIPGHDGLDDDHWQKRWLNKLPTARLIEPGTFSNMDDWAGRIVTASGAASKPVILVAHGSGITAVAHAAAQLASGRIAGAFMVAAHDPDRDTEDLRNKGSMANGADTGQYEPPAPSTALPLDKLPFPAVLIASSTCPHCTPARARAFANAWGSTLIEAGDAGSLDAASGHGPWPEGLMRFGAFLNSLD